MSKKTKRIKRQNQTLKQSNKILGIRADAMEILSSPEFRWVGSVIDYESLKIGNLEKDAYDYILKFLGNDDHETGSGE